MSIAITNVQQRDASRLRVDITLDGSPWIVGDVPVEFMGDDAAILAHLSSRERGMWADRQCKCYPNAVVNMAGDETRCEAWERVLAAGVDDAGAALAGCVGR